MDKIKILVVDDESRMRKLVHDFLAREGYEVLEAGDGEEALDIFYQQKDIALLVLDIMMPRINGFEVCREIRQTSKVPIIMLTAKGDERDELNGFDIGADEYISKPFSPKILVARVNALLRRANKLGKEAIISEAGGIVMDKTAHTVAIDGKDIELSVKEFELLDYFMSNQGIALTRERILDSVWSYDYFGDARTIDTHVKKLRSKMGAKGDYIKTVWGVGYKGFGIRGVTMKKKKTLSTQLTLVISFIVLLIVGVFWMANNTLLEKYYVFNKEKEMLAVYKMVDLAAKNDKLSDDTFAVAFEKKCVGANIDAVVFNKYGKVIIEGTTDNQEIFQLLLEASMSSYSADYNNLNMTRQKDKRLGTEYIIINNRLIDGNFVYMKTPLESIKESVSISNRFFAIGTVAAIVVGVFMAYIVARNMTRPIRNMTELSTRMAKLDFDAKYIDTENSAKELYVLGEHMNELSQTLEQTITRLKVANNELQRDIKKKEEIDEMRKEFLSNVSHELKTPLALISGYAEGLKEVVNDDDESRNFYCDVIMDETDKMNRMVMKLLSLNHLEDGSDVLEMTRFDLTSLVRGVIDSSKLLAQKNEAAIEFDRTDSVYVSGDIYKIEEVVTNYISNAINHCTRGGTITVSYSMYSDRVRVSVFNTGEPIPDKDIENIWNKFYKVDKARTREYGGSGIGLSIVKAIMELHHRGYGVINHKDGVEFWFELELFIANNQ